MPNWLGPSSPSRSDRNPISGANLSRGRRNRVRCRGSQFGSRARGQNRGRHATSDEDEDSGPPNESKTGLQARVSSPRRADLPDPQFRTGLAMSSQPPCEKRECPVAKRLTKGPRRTFSSDSGHRVRTISDQRTLLCPIVPGQSSGFRLVSGRIPCSPPAAQPR